MSFCLYNNAVAEAKPKVRSTSVIVRHCSNVSQMAFAGSLRAVTSFVSAMTQKMPRRTTQRKSTAPVKLSCRDLENVTRQRANSIRGDSTVSGKDFLALRRMLLQGNPRKLRRHLVPFSALQS